MSQRLRTLHEDRRGAITLAGLAMAFVLAIGCYHIFATGVDTFSKIAGQVQSDASALEGAAWHATGMNLLVTLNIAMAFVLIPFLVVRLATLVVVVGLVAVLALSWVPGVAGGIAPLTRALDWMHKTEDRIAPPIMNTLYRISRAERLVAATVPWVAASLPINRATGNPRGVPFSISLLPDVDQWFKDVGGHIHPSRRLIGGLKPRTQFPARMGSLAKPDPGTADTLKQKILAKLPTKSSGWIDFFSGSLPAQEEDYFQVCSRAAEGAASLVTSLLVHTVGLGQGTADSISSGFGKVVGSIQTVTCTPIKQFKGTLTRELDQQVLDSCKKKKDQYLQGPRHAAEPGKPRTWTTGMQQQCEKDQRAAAEKAASDGVKEQASVEDIKTAAVWGEMLRPQLSPMLHVWMYYHREDPEPMVYSAEAEYFAPCDSFDRASGNGDDYDSDGRSCGDNAMWRYGWDVVMVSHRSLEEELVAHFGDFMRGWANRFVAKGIQGVIGRIVNSLPLTKVKIGSSAPPLPWIGGRHQRQPLPAAELIYRHIRGLRTGELGNAYWNRRWAGSKVVKNTFPPDKLLRFRLPLGDLTTRAWH